VINPVDCETCVFLLVGWESRCLPVPTSRALSHVELVYQILSSPLTMSPVVWSLAPDPFMNRFEHILGHLQY